MKPARTRSAGRGGVGDASIGLGAAAALAQYPVPQGAWAPR